MLGGNEVGIVHGGIARGLEGCIGLMAGTLPMMRRSFDQVVAELRRVWMPRHIELESLFGTVPDAFRLV